MVKEFNAAAGAEVSAEVSREEFTSVMTALEPDQIVSTKEHHHCPRRRLTRTEMLLFWALRIYLVFMVGVVVYQIWTSVR
ncbi:MAG: hypothetical protein ABSD76_15490 [Terriglobales bacterium]|jgi:hypothetical protein